MKECLNKRIRAHLEGVQNYTEGYLEMCRLYLKGVQELGVQRDSVKIIIVKGY